MIFKKFIFYLLLIFLAINFSAIAQRGRRQVENLPKSDHQKIHFGFTLGFNSSSLRVQLVDSFRTRDSVYSVVPSAVAGLDLGILANLKLGKHFDLRFTPTLAFTQRNLEYNFIYSDTTQGLISKKVESTYLQFPFDLKFNSVRISNYRVYVLAGFCYSIDMVSQASVVSKDKEYVKLNKHDYGYEIGVGFDFYMTYFKFSPEIKMFNGIPNLLVQDGRKFSNPLQALYSKIFLVSLNFSD